MSGFICAYYGDLLIWYYTIVDIFSFISGLATDLLGFADQGTSFLTATSVVDLHWFLTGVIPAILL